MSATLRLMTVRFDMPLRRAEVTAFRGAVIAAAGREHTMFHNHMGEGYAYRYPLIQYRTFGGRAALICLNEGVEEVQALFNGRFLADDVVLGGDNRGPVGVEDIRVRELCLSELDTPVGYHLHDWLPLNQTNYREWQLLDTEQMRLDKLEAVLTGNIISFAKGVGWQIGRYFKVTIDPESVFSRPCRHKGQTLMAFSLDFAVDLFLPAGIGLGKGAALNHGVVSRQMG